MILEGNHEVVLAVLREKRSLLAAGQPHDHIKPLLFIGGGVLKGVYGGGAVTALYQSGYGNVFDWVVGSSTGAPTACYFLSEQPWLGTSIYWEECCTRQFIDKRRVFTQLCDTGYITDVFFNSDRKSFDIDAVLRSRSVLVMGVTIAWSAKPKLVVPRTESELRNSLSASIAIPGASRGGAMIDGEWCVDGSYSDPLPMQVLVEKYQPTHLVVIANRGPAVEDDIPVGEKVLNSTVWRRRMSAVLREAAHNRRRAFKRELGWLRTRASTPYIVVWGDDSVSSTRQDSRSLYVAAERSRRWWHSLLTAQK